VEKSERFLDKNVMFQFLTDVVEDEHVLQQLQNGTVKTAVLAARVIEIAKRKDINEPNMITIGRSPDNDIVIYNKLVSRRHAYLLLNHKEKRCSLIDIGSRNGTFLNDTKINPHEEYQLAEADEISIGPETKVVYFSSKAFHSFLSELKSP
jgi:pSer/pThr/pTyr-binding forkhead associated (FHA) protein